MKHCNKCGAQLEKEGAKFCPKCGSEAPKVDTNQNNQTNNSNKASGASSNDTNYNSGKAGSKKTVYIVVSIIVVAIIIIGIVTVVLMKKKSEEESNRALANAVNDYLGSTTVSDTTKAITARPTTATTFQSTASTYQPNIYQPSNGGSYLESLILAGNQRYYTDYELSSLSKYDLGLLRNGLYALSGRKFQKQEYNQYFSGFSWYTPDTYDDSIVKSRWNSYQRANLEKIVQYE